MESEKQYHMERNAQKIKRIVFFSIAGILLINWIVVKFLLPWDYSMNYDVGNGQLLPIIFPFIIFILDGKGKKIPAAICAAIWLVCAVSIQGIALANGYPMKISIIIGILPCVLLLVYTLRKQRGYRPLWFIAALAIGFIDFLFVKGAIQSLNIHLLMYGDMMGLFSFFGKALAAIYIPLGFWMSEPHTNGKKMQESKTSHYSVLDAYKASRK